METLELLAVALGLAALAGVNLYLTVFVVSLSLNVGWIELGPEYAQLAVLAHPAILLLSGILTVIEFFADKILWVDSIWDGIHTAIRPVGAAFLAIAVLGNMDPALEIIAALFCGGVALTTHATKSGLRLLVNTSPEPFSNILASFVEDAGIVGAMVLLYKFPLITMGVVVLFVVASFFFAPALLRAVWIAVRLVFHAIFRFELKDFEDAPLPNTLPALERKQLAKDLVGDEPITWAVSVLTGRNSKLSRNRAAFLVYLQRSSRIGLIMRGKPSRWLETARFEVHDAYRPLFNELSFFDRTRNESLVVRFFKNKRGEMEKVLSSFRETSEPDEPKIPKTTLGSFRKER